MRACWPAMVAAACALAPLIATAGEPTVVRDGLDRVVTLPAPPQRIVTIFASNTEMVAALGLPIASSGSRPIRAIPRGGEQAVGRRPARLFVMPWWDCGRTSSSSRRRGRPSTNSSIRWSGWAFPSSSCCSEACRKSSPISACWDAWPACQTGARHWPAASSAASRHHAARAGPPAARAVMITGGSEMAFCSWRARHLYRRRARARRRRASRSQAVVRLPGIAEAILDADPDVLLYAGSVADRDDLIRRPGWSEMRAVKAQRAYAVSRAELLIPGPRVVDGVEHLAALLHPVACGAMKVWLGLVLILGCAAVVAACAGHEWASPFDLARALAGDDSLRSRLLVEWRIPRVFAAAFVGVLLGLGGAVFQGVFRNPLAEPYLLGSAGGAALAPQSRCSCRSDCLNRCSSRAGVCRSVERDRPGHRRLSGCRRRRRAGMLLAGVAVAAVLGALRSFMMLALSDETVSLQVVLSWVLGACRRDMACLGSLRVVGACLGLTLLFARGLDMIGLGEVMATAFGLDVNGSSRSRCWRAPLSWRPPSPSADWSRSLACRVPYSALARRPMHRRCCRRPRWSALRSSPSPMRSHGRRCRLGIPWAGDRRRGGPSSLLSPQAAHMTPSRRGLVLGGRRDAARGCALARGVRSP